MRHLIDHHLRRHTISFRHAIDGILWAWKSQPNYRVHTLISLVVISAGVFYDISIAEWIVVIMLISIGLVIETINTALEATADAITHEWSGEIKIAKDAAAAAMLTYAMGSTVIAGIIFIPKML